MEASAGPDCCVAVVKACIACANKRLEWERSVQRFEGNFARYWMVRFVNKQ